MPNRRLRRLPSVALPQPLHRIDVRLACDPLARLIGLAGLGGLPHGTALLLPGTRSVHTFGMRFALDLIWLGRDGGVVRVDWAVSPGRLRGCRAACAVLEVAAAGPCDDAAHQSVRYPG